MTEKNLARYQVTWWKPGVVPSHVTHIGNLAGKSREMGPRQVTAPNRYWCYQPRRATTGGVLGVQTPALFVKRAKVPFFGKNCVNLMHCRYVFRRFLAIKYPNLLNCQGLELNIRVYCVEI